MRKLTKVLALLLALLMTLSLFGCTAKEEPKAESKTEETKKEEPKEEEKKEELTAETQTVEAAGESFKKNVVIGVPRAPQIVDCQEFTNTEDYTVHWLSHDTLFHNDPETGELIPWLCESYEVEGEWWTLHLRQGVKFHDGTDFDAEDVAFTLFTRGQNATQIKSFCTTLTEYEIVDPYTIKICTGAPNMDFGPRMGNITFGMLSKESCEADPEKGYYYGTGAFQITEFVENSHETFTRFDGYWGEAPVTETIEVRGYEEASARLIALQNGEIDVCIAPATTELEDIKADANLELIEAVGGVSEYLSFNVEKEPMNNIEFRQAIAYAIDDMAVIDMCCDGYGTISNTIYGPNSVVCADDVLTGYEYNLEKAKELIEKNSWNGLKVKLLVADSGLNNSVALCIQPMLLAAGLDVEIDPRGTAEVKAARDAGEHDILVGGFSCSDYCDSLKSSCSSTGSYNFARFKDDEIDQQLNDGLAMTNWEERSALYKGIQVKVFDEMCYYYPIFRANANVAMKKGTGGFFVRCDMIIDFTNIAVPE